MKICTACARKTDESGSFCPECGAALRDAMRATTAPASSDDRAQTDMSSAERLVGTTIDGQFAIDAILGGGAFGTVYRGRQVGLDRPVAIKVPTFEIASDPVMSRRFAREARSAARVAHPGVVSIYAVGELQDGRPYLAMQLVDGQPLDRILAEGPIDPTRALRIARAIASALSETHAAEVVHRDLKPSNVMWRRDRNGDDRITLVDFGIAVCRPGNADATRLTAGGGLIGTPHYMSPEQAHGEQVDARADLYGLGCLLFELVTGTTPFDGSGFEVLLAHLGRPAPAPSERNPNVPEAIDRLCAALLAKKPDDRPPHADAVVALLDEALAELEGRPHARSAAPAVPPPRPKRTLATRRDLPDGTPLPRARKTRRMLLAGVAAIVALAATGFAVHELRGRPQTATADPIDDDPRVGNRRSLYKDNGEMIAQLLIPEPLVAGLDSGMRLDLKNKLGQPVIADEIVLTIADTGGVAKGLTARPSRTKGRYYFRYTFAQPGRHTLRVFPPSVDSSFEIPVDVVR